MKFNRSLISVICALSISILPSYAQQRGIIPDLSGTTNQDNRVTVNRDAEYSDGEVHLDARPGNGLLILKETNFSDGRIELDIKGKNEPQQSFVGLAFHGVNDSTYDAVYFRPFNFKNPDRDTHSVQYIAMPKFDWYVLRQEYPGRFENKLTTVPDPDGWFHVKIEFYYPEVKVYVNDSRDPSLTVSQISMQTQGWVGFWVGNGSDGYFRNLKIYPGQ